MTSFKTITSDELDQVTGGVDWDAAITKGKQWGGRAGAYGGSIGAAVGTLGGGPPGTFALGAIGLAAGLGGGFVAGVAKGAYETRNQ